MVNCSICGHDPEAHSGKLGQTCDDCFGKCRQILPPVVTALATQMQSVRNAYDAIWEVEIRIVRDAREAGLTWEEIAILTRLSRQGAQRKYMPYIVEKTTYHLRNGEKK